MKVLLIGALLLTASCSFKSEEELGKLSEELKNQSIERIDPSLDTDGDKILDIIEIKEGRNRFIADLPDLRTKFLQSYSIKIKYLDLKTKTEGIISIDSHKNRDEVGFKYRVGDLLIIKKAHANAAKIGRFSTHSIGEIYQEDLSWTRYPSVSSKERHENNQSYSKYFDTKLFEIKAIDIYLKNEVRLSDSSFYSSIKDLKLNYYYYDIEKERIQNLKTMVISRSFSRGINESFNVKIENAPVTLIRDSYLRFGRFIFSEVDDYKIPQIETSFKNLLVSVKNRTIPLVVNTPLETKILYVGLGNKSQTLVEVLDKAFGSKIDIKNNEVVSINQFKNNLPDYTYLSEVKSLDKKGKWFIFTNDLNTGVFDYKFTKGDSIILSYLTGAVLSRQIKKTNSYTHGLIESKKESSLVPLGAAEKNSKISFYLKPFHREGTIRTITTQSPRSNGVPCRGNQICKPYSCSWDIAEFNDYDEKLNFLLEDSNEFNRIKLVIGSSTYSFKELIENKKIKVSNKNGLIFIEFIQNDPIDEIDLLTINEKINLFIEIDPKWNESFSGVKVTKAEGQGSGSCFEMALTVAHQNNIPVSVDSLNFSRWESGVNWSLFTRGYIREISEDFSFSISSIITDFYN